ncbi:MAG: hypothetical protein M1835_000058 [Candelina submexicana]|nr:MAG: hypothetical protein M1835_000058 [Candelina submexicana]
MTVAEYEGIRKVFHPLRHLAYGLTPGSSSAAHEIDTKQLISLTPLLEYLSLSMDHEQLRMTLPAGLTWPRLKTFKFFHGDVEADALMEFLVRHLPTLTTVELSCVNLVDGPWKPILGLLRAEPKSTETWDNGEKDVLEDAPTVPKQPGYKAKVESLREGFGEEPFQGEDDEENVLDLFLSGCGAWDWRLESVYGENSV